MEGFVILLIWLGGIHAAPEGTGFWRTMFWPYYAGKSFAAQFGFKR